MTTTSVSTARAFESVRLALGAGVPDSRRADEREGQLLEEDIQRAKSEPSGEEEETLEGKGKTDLDRGRNHTMPAEDPRSHVIHWKESSERH
ncbi:hypothetical protein NDU88_003546 [Pleurodeles waltl]|uniref:Uncharacterized protein n=1 Tax=Pleurodeles waltl TaxID=8319 RepID=A0AAV7SGA9_PLEWA|nr:hypothetical protein NDU88_003546 [Pleurodeles waltl]